MKDGIPGDRGGGRASCGGRGLHRGWRLGRGGRLFTVGEDARLMDALHHFRELVEHILAEATEAISDRIEDEVWTGLLEDLGVCEVHSVPLHELGCVICNDAPIDAPPEQAPNRAQEPHRS